LRTYSKLALAAAVVFCNILTIVTIAITSAPAYASANFITPIELSTIKLPVSGNLIEKGQLYYNPSNQQPNWDAPEAFLEQLKPTHDINIKGGDFWLNLSLKNTTEIERWSVQVDGSFIEHIQTFIFTHSATQNMGYSQSRLAESSKGGQFDGGGYLHHYGMDITLAPNTNYDVWINLQSRYFTASPHVQIFTTKDFANDVNTNNFLIIGCLGSIIILALYNFLIYVWTQAKEYLFYSAYLISTFVGWAAVFGIFSHFFNSNSIALIMLPFYTNIIFNVYFYQHFLDLPEKHPLMSKLSYCIVGMCLVLMAAYRFTPEWISYVFINVVNAIWLVTGLFCGVRRLQEGYKPARFFVLGFSTVFIGGAFIILPYFGFPRFIKEAYLVALIGQTLDVLFLALALADRINNLRKEKEVALKLAHDTEKSANQTLTFANNKLIDALNIAAQNQRQKDEFLIAVSHELRTPLNAITASLSQLRHSHEPSEQQTLQNYIQFGAERLAAQVENIVILAELDEKNITPLEETFSAGELLEELEEMAQGYLIEKNIKFKTIRSSSVSDYYTGDKHLLVRMLAPIIDNACQYTASGNINLQLADKWGNLIFEVIDSGPGIPADRQEGIFDSFMQVSSGYQRDHEGLGLGLAISKRIAELLGASIEFDVVIPHGCHCIVTLPIRKQEIAPQHNVHNIHTAHALIVEDNTVNAKVLQTLLSNLGVSADIAENGLIALNVTDHNHYDLIFMDLQMPKMDGFAATESIRSKGITTPVIAVTANSDYKSRKRCAEVGMNDFLAKPIKKSTLLQSIKRWVG